jgi:hypothetical protein
MKTHRLLLAALSLAAVAPVAPTAGPIGSAVEQTAAKSASQERTPPPPVQLTAGQIASMLDGGAVLISTKQPPIWVARAKRGNRARRSRWNYNR